MTNSQTGSVVQFRRPVPTPQSAPESLHAPPLTVSSQILEECRIVDYLMRDWEDRWRNRMMLYWAFACVALYMLGYFYPSPWVMMTGVAAIFCGLICYHTRGPSPPQWLKDARREGFKSSVSKKDAAS